MIQAISSVGVVAMLILAMMTPGQASGQTLPHHAEGRVGLITGGMDDGGGWRVDLRAHLVLAPRFSVYGAWARSTYDRYAEVEGGWGGIPGFREEVTPTSEAFKLGVRYVEEPGTTSLFLEVAAMLVRQVHHFDTRALGTNFQGDRHPGIELGAGLARPLSGDLELSLAIRRTVYGVSGSTPQIDHLRRRGTFSYWVADVGISVRPFRDRTIQSDG